MMPGRLAHTDDVGDPAAPAPHSVLQLTCRAPICAMCCTAHRGDIVRLETYFAEDGRLTTRRDWRLTDATTGRYLGAATR